MKEECCAACKASLSDQIRYIIAYVDGKSIYSRFCKNCTRSHWKELEANHPELFRSVSK